MLSWFLVHSLEQEQTFSKLVQRERLCALRHYPFTNQHEERKGLCDRVCPGVRLQVAGWGRAVGAVRLDLPQLPVHLDQPHPHEDQAARRQDDLLEQLDSEARPQLQRRRAGPGTRADRA